MTKITLPFLNEGKPFEPHLDQVDLANYDEAELAEVARGNAPDAPPAVRLKAKHAVLELQRVLVEKVLRASLPDGGTKEIRLSVSQMRGAFAEIYAKGSEPWTARPLDQPGSASAPSRSPV